MKLKGRIALVTNASKGMGACVAERLAADGATVVVNARHRDDAGAVVDRIEASGGSAVAIAAGLSSVEGIESLFAATKDKPSTSKRRCSPRKLPCGCFRQPEASSSTYRPARR